MHYITNRTAKSGQTVKNLCQLAYEFELDQTQRKSTQVGGQTKRKLSASRKLALTCSESVWPGPNFLLYFILQNGHGYFIKRKNRTQSSVFKVNMGVKGVAICDRKAVDVFWDVEKVSCIE